MINETIFFFLLFISLTFAQVDSVLQVEEYYPKPTLVVQEHIITKAKYPFVVLETDDEYFDYYRKRHAFWKM